MRTIFVLGAFLVTLMATAKARAEATTTSGAAYATLCRSRGVPLPPTWGTSAWKYNGFLTNSQEYILQDRQANVYYYQQTTSPTGVCITLPRSAPGTGSVPKASFGVICQGTNGKVCFWDNALAVPWNDNNGNTVFSAQAVITSETAANIPNPPVFIGGAALSTHPGGMCTDCHAGENPYIIHLATALDLNALGVSLNTGVWYDPIVATGWNMNPGPGAVPSATNPALTPGVDGSCLQCHTGPATATNGKFGRFPTLSTANRGYCGAVLTEAKNRKTMPPFTTTLSYAKHYDALLATCTQAPVTPPIQMPPTVRMTPSAALFVAMTAPLYL